MTVLSVDLASRAYHDIGLVTLTRLEGVVLVTPVRFAELGIHGRPEPKVLATFLVALAGELGASAIGLDGPQGWKDPSNGYQHARACEALLHTQGKTGVPGHTKPANYLGFIEFSIATFDALADLGWPRLQSPDAAGPVAVETFPTAAWRALGMSPLPGKSTASEEQVREWTDRLIALGGIQVGDRLSHDELAAAVSGLGILSLAESTSHFEIVGQSPFERGGNWFEGYIVNPRTG